MAKQLTSREKLAFKIDHLSESEVDELVEYVAIMESLRRERRRADLFDDELAASLSSAYENKKARQVMEWESVRRRPARQAAFR